MAAMMLDVAVGWLVYDVTGSAMFLGLAGLVAFLPVVLFILVVGNVADRYDRRNVLIVAMSVKFLASAALFAVASWPAPNVAIIFALLFTFGSARAFYQPTAQAITPALVPKDDFANAVGWNSTAWQIASIGGPAIGGLLYAFGSSIVFGATTLFCLIGLLALTQVTSRKVPPRDKVTWAYLTAGFSYIWSRHIVLSVISIDLFAVLLGGATALLPIYARDIFHTGPLGLGILRSMPAIGALTCSLVVLAYPIKRRAGLTMLGAVAVFGAATVGFGLSSNFWVAIPFLLLMGAGDMVSVVIRQTIVQIETPDDMRGRVSAANSVFVGASNELGAFESGALASVTGAAGSVVLGGLGSILIAIIWGKIFPALRNRNELATPQK